VDPEQRAARAVVAEGARRGQRAVQARADLVAAQPEAEPDVRGVRLPAVIDRDALVELVRLVTGPVPRREIEHRARQNALAVERSAAPQHLGEAEEIGHRRYAADPRHL